MPKSLPPLNPLHVFEVATRLRSFTKAAEELNVTQSAVSRQVSVLENYLDVRLFRRERNGVVLTPVGEAYRAKIAPAFAAIAAATAQLQGQRKSEPLHVHVYTVFAVHWLLRRLYRFHKEYPKIEVKVSTSLTAGDFEEDGIDLRIRLTNGVLPNLQHQLLFTDVIQPVCSPKLLLDGHRFDDINDLGNHRLLRSQSRLSDWPEWLLARGRGDMIRDGVQFENSVLSYQAAIDGMGVVVGQMRLLEREIQENLLVPLFEPQEREFAYYAYWPAEKEDDPKVRAFLGWLKRETAPDALQRR